MSKLSQHETQLVGQWIEQDGKIVGDETCQRIDELTKAGLEAVQDHPDYGGWMRLYRDKSDGRYWERYYPQSGLHGGGPPALRCRSPDEVAIEYFYQRERLPPRDEA